MALESGPILRLVSEQHTHTGHKGPSKASYPVVLVGRDRCEARFLKNKGFIILLGIFLAVFAGVHVNHVEPGLVAVHGVQNDL